MPARAYDKDGQRRWAQVCEILDDDLKRQIETLVLAEFQKLAVEAGQVHEGDVW